MGLVLRDKIVVTWPRSNMASEDYLLQQIDALPEIDKAAFWQLTCRDEYGDKSFQQAIGIMQNNALQYNTTRNNVDLLLNLSLINNSCSPNCVAAPVLNSLNIRDVVAFKTSRWEKKSLCAMRHPTCITTRSTDKTGSRTTGILNVSAQGVG